MDYFDYVRDKLKDIVVAVVVVVLSLLVVGLVSSSLWYTLFNTMISFLIFDAILSFYLVFGRFFYKSMEKGYLFISYFLGILFASFLSYYIGQELVGILSGRIGWLPTLLISSLLIVGIVFLAFRARYYQNPDKKEAQNL